MDFVQRKGLLLLRLAETEKGNDETGSALDVELRN